MSFIWHLSEDQHPPAKILHFNLKFSCDKQSWFSFELNLPRNWHVKNSWLFVDFYEINKKYILISRLNPKENLCFVNYSKNFDFKKRKLVLMNLANTLK